MKVQIDSTSSQRISQDTIFGRQASRLSDSRVQILAGNVKRNNRTTSHKMDQFESNALASLVIACQNHASFIREARRLTPKVLALAQDFRCRSLHRDYTVIGPIL